VTTGDGGFAAAGGGAAAFPEAPGGAVIDALPPWTTLPTSVELPVIRTCALPPATMALSDPSMCESIRSICALPAAAMTTDDRSVHPWQVTWQLPPALMIGPAAMFVLIPETLTVSLPPHSS